MTDAERDELVHRTADEIFLLRTEDRNVTSRALARAALAVAEPVFHAVEQERCAALVGALEVAKEALVALPLSHRTEKQAAAVIAIRNALRALTR